MNLFMLGTAWARAWMFDLDYADDLNRAVWLPYEQLATMLGGWRTLWTELEATLGEIDDMHPFQRAETQYARPVVINHPRTSSSKMSPREEMYSSLLGHLYRSSAAPDTGTQFEDHLRHDRMNMRAAGSHGQPHEYQVQGAQGAIFDTAPPKRLADRYDAEGDELHSTPAPGAEHQVGGAAEASRLFSIDQFEDSVAAPRRRDLPKMVKTQDPWGMFVDQHGNVIKPTVDELFASRRYALVDRLMAAESAGGLNSQEISRHHAKIALLKKQYLQSLGGALVDGASSYLAQITGARAGAGSASSSSGFQQERERDEQIRQDSETLFQFKAKTFLRKQKLTQHLARSYAFAWRRLENDAPEQTSARRAGDWGLLSDYWAQRDFLLADGYGQHAAATRQAGLLGLNMRMVIVPAEDVIVEQEPFPFVQLAAIGGGAAPSSSGVKQQGAAAWTGFSDPAFALAHGRTLLQEAGFAEVLISAVSHPVASKHPSTAAMMKGNVGEGAGVSALPCPLIRLQWVSGDRIVWSDEELPDTVGGSLCPPAPTALPRRGAGGAGKGDADAIRALKVAILKVLSEAEMRSGVWDRGLMEDLLHAKHLAHRIETELPERSEKNGFPDEKADEAGRGGARVISMGPLALPTGARPARKNAEKSTPKKSPEVLKKSSKLYEAAKASGLIDSAVPYDGNAAAFARMYLRNYAREDDKLAQFAIFCSRRVHALATRSFLGSNFHKSLIPAVEKLSKLEFERRPAAVTGETGDGDEDQDVLEQDDLQSGSLPLMLEATLRPESERWREDVPADGPEMTGVNTDYLSEDQAWDALLLDKEDVRDPLSSRQDAVEARVVLEAVMRDEAFVARQLLRYPLLSLTEDQALSTLVQVNMEAVGWGQRWDHAAREVGAERPGKNRKAGARTSEAPATDHMENENQDASRVAGWKMAGAEAAGLQKIDPETLPIMAAIQRPYRPRTKGGKSRGFGSIKQNETAIGDCDSNFAVDYLANTATEASPTAIDVGCFPTTKTATAVAPEGKEQQRTVAAKTDAKGKASQTPYKPSKVAVLRELLDVLPFSPQIDVDPQHLSHHVERGSVVSSQSTRTTPEDARRRTTTRSDEQEELEAQKAVKNERRQITVRWADGYLPPHALGTLQRRPGESPAAMFPFSRFPYRIEPGVLDPCKPGIPRYCSEGSEQLNFVLQTSQSFRSASDERCLHTPVERVTQQCENLRQDGSYFQERDEGASGMEGDRDSVGRGPKQEEAAERGRATRTGAPAAADVEKLESLVLVQKRRSSKEPALKKLEELMALSDAEWNEKRRDESRPGADHAGEADDAAAGMVRPTSTSEVEEPVAVVRKQVEDEVRATRDALAEMDDMEVLLVERMGFLRLQDATTEQEQSAMEKQLETLRATKDSLAQMDQLEALFVDQLRHVDDELNDHTQDAAAGRGEAAVGKAAKAKSSPSTPTTRTTAGGRGNTPPGRKDYTGGSCRKFKSLFGKTSRDEEGGSSLLRVRDALQGRAWDGWFARKFVDNLILPPAGSVNAGSAKRQLWDRERSQWARLFRYFGPQFVVELGEAMEQFLDRCVDQRVFRVLFLEVLEVMSSSA
eukprot:g7480.t1